MVGVAHGGKPTNVVCADIYTCTHTHTHTHTHTQITISHNTVCCGFESTRPSHIHIPQYAHTYSHTTHQIIQMHHPCMSHPHTHTHTHTHTHIHTHAHTHHTHTNTLTHHTTTQHTRHTHTGWSAQFHVTVQREGRDRVCRGGPIHGDWCSLSDMQGRHLIV